MRTIATAKVQRNYNCYNVYFNECLRKDRLFFVMFQIFGTLLTFPPLFRAARVLRYKNSRPCIPHSRLFFTLHFSLFTLPFYSPTGAKRGMNRTARWLSGSSSDDVSLDSINDVLYIIISDIWAGRQAHTNLEDCFRYTIHISKRGIVS